MAEGAELPEGGMVRNADKKANRCSSAASAELWPTKSNAACTAKCGCACWATCNAAAPPTTFDRVLATQFGAHAVRLVVEGRFGEMICYHPPEMISVPILEAVHKVRTVDSDGCAVQCGSSAGH